ncbi:hypothetical protein Tco_0478796 [Tanacetum coccineum]
MHNISWQLVSKDRLPMLDQEDIHNGETFSMYIYTKPNGEVTEKKHYYMVYVPSTRIIVDSIERLQTGGIIDVQELKDQSVLELEVYFS